MAVFRWLQAFAVLVLGLEGFDPAETRPVLAVEEEGRPDPFEVRFVLVVPNDAGELRRVSMDNCRIGGVGTWSQLLMLSQRQKAVEVPNLKVPPDLRRV